MCVAYRFKNSIEDALLEYQGDGPKYQGEVGEDEEENLLGGKPGEDHYNSIVHHPLKDASTARTDQTTILLILRDPSHPVPARMAILEYTGTAVVRIMSAFPSYSLCKAFS
jgi:hypothetical protein